MLMKTKPVSAIQHLAALAVVMLLSSLTVAQEQQRGSEKYLCSEPNPQAICTAENTCGSASAPCTVEIKRTASSASATPMIPKAKGNQPFCVKAGTTVIWKSGSKNTGFVLDFGPDLPFGSEAIIGGSDRSSSTVANKKGCYKYSVGACVSGAIYGMCDSAEAELVITAPQ
jgi:hypothetical protein